jgi:hypothetical protein
MANVLNVLHEIAADYERKVIETWRYEEHFGFGIKIAREYRLTTLDIEILFNEILHEYVKEENTGC